MAEFDITRIPRYSSKSSYAHFDHRVSFAEAQTKILDPEYVSHHAFYPLISNEIITVRFRGGKRSCKVRNIAYASHFDHRVYQYYSYLWSDLYNRKATEGGFNDAAVAYRSSLSSDSVVTAASNISSAKKAFDYLRNQDSAFVLTGDFKSFFDNLNHVHLMTSLRSLFPGGRLPDDHYQVIKNILHYSCWPIADLAARHDLPWPAVEPAREKMISGAAIELRFKAIRELNKLDVILPKTEFLASKSKVITRPWKRKGVALGIPQGLAASGVLANIYMADIDMKVRLAVEWVGGLYLRYCDDFIVAVPMSGFDALVETINLMAYVDSVKLQPEKTKVFRVDGDGVAQLDFESVRAGKVYSYSGAHPAQKVSFLGFDFDGRVVRLRQSTVGRYHKRLREAATAIARSNQGEGRHASKRRVSALYQHYSPLGIKGRRLCPSGDACLSAFSRYGNFLSYVARAQKAFPNDPIAPDEAKVFRKIKRLSAR